MLSQDDVLRLLTDPSAVARAETAARIAAEFDHGEMGPTERKIAEEIFRLMVRDAEVRVREALAQNLKSSRDVPHEVVLALAKDTGTVSEPILKFSEVLTDNDLVEIVRTQDAAKQIVIAGRATVSEKVSATLVETRNEAVVQTLVANEGAAISEKSLQKVVDDFGNREGIQAAMVHRPKLPVTVAERLVTLVSEKLKTELVKRHELPAELATNLLLSSRERAVIGISSEAEEQDVETLVRQMRQHGRLTPSIILRAAVMGDMTFFEAALAELAGIPLVNARPLIYDEGTLGLRSLCDKAKLPASHITAIRAAVGVSRETGYDGGDHDHERYMRRMIERVLTQYGDLGVVIEGDDLEYLLKKMGELPALPEGVA